MNIAIMGTGAYGIALAMKTVKKHQVTMWTKLEDEYHMLKDYRKNIKVLPNTIIPEEIKITMDLKKCVEKKDIIILAIPSTSYHDVLQELKNNLASNTLICIASKGITSDQEFLSDVVKQYIQNEIVVLSGPSFAIDLVNNKPIGLTIASEKIENIKKIESLFTSNDLGFDHTDDIIGTQICGMIKNVFAIGSGILEGLNCPESTKASYITKCIQELKMFLPIISGNSNTVFCYCGIGDLLLTCGSTKSRNFSYGKLIGSRASKEEIEIFKENHLIEGIYALEGIYKTMKSKNYIIQIIDLIYHILIDNQNPELLLSFMHKKASY